VRSQAQIQKEGTSGPKKIRCVLIHDHVLLRQGLRRLLEDEPDIEVVGEGTAAADGLRQISQQQPEVAITDPGIFGAGAYRAERVLQQASPNTKVLFLAEQRSQDTRDDRAFGFPCAARQTSAEELVAMVRRVHAGAGNLREMPHRPRTEPREQAFSRKRALTTREQQVLKLLAEGRTVRSAADVLGLSIKTVDAHKFNLMRKLGIHNKAELVMCAIQKKVVGLPLSS
jgi:two-component system, NarL family, response regulator NreC